MLASNPLRAAAATLLCLVPLALGLKFTNDNFSIKPDEPFEVKWEGQAKDSGLLLRVIDADDDSAVRSYDVGFRSSAEIVFSDEIESGKYYFQIQETASGQRATSETFRYENGSKGEDTRKDDTQKDDKNEDTKDDALQNEGSQDGKEKGDENEQDDDSGSTSAKSATTAVAASAVGLSALLALGLVCL